MNVSVPTKLFLNPSATKQHFVVRVDPELLTLRGEKAHCETYLEPVGDCHGRIVLPSRTVPLWLVAHEMTHAAIDVATLFIPALEGESETETVDRKHEAAALMVENMVRQLKLAPEKHNL